MHSMVLLGFRQENGTGGARGGQVKTFFFIQNWWREKQFVEVSAEYFAVCRPRVYFVVDPPLTKFREGATSNDGVFGESAEGFDTDESYYLDD